MSEASGKKTRIVISCTTMETVRVSEPVIFYEADVAHIIYLNENDDDFYESIIDEIKSQILKRRTVDIITHNETVYRYNVMLKTVNDLIRLSKEQYGDYADIYVNISSGTAEYAAAAMCACMMNPGTIPFTVRVKEHSIPLEKYKELTFSNGRPVGDAKSVYDPKMIETFNIDPPEEDLVRYLAFFANIEDRPYTSETIIRMLDMNDVWKYTPTKTKNPGKNAAKIQYTRVVLEPLKEKGWIKNGRSKNRWIITPAGRSILDIFHNEEDDRSFNEIVCDIVCCRDMICRSVKLLDTDSDDDED